MNSEVRDAEVLLKCAVVAFLIESFILFAVGFQGHWLAHPQKTGLDDSKFIEAQVFEPPQDAHLVETHAPPAVHHVEPVLSKNPNQGRKAKPGEQQMVERNETQNGPPPLATHGPVAIFSPPPVIPAYMRDKDLKTSVVIDFYVNAQGASMPRLAGSSGDEELDALALETAKKWQFRPAEQDHKAIDAKVRLRIVFEVQ